MNSINPQSTSFQEYPKQRLYKRVEDNSFGITVGGGAGVVTFGTLRNSSRIGNSFIKAVNSSKSIKAQKQDQLLKIFGKFKPCAKYVNNPIVKKVAGGLAGLSAVTGLIGATAKIADTYGFLAEQNK